MYFLNKTDMERIRGLSQKYGDNFSKSRVLFSEVREINMEIKYKSYKVDHDI